MITKYFLVLISIREGPPKVILEARGADLPVAAADGGDRSEVVERGETGWLVPAQNIAALANSLSHLLSNVVVRPSFGQAGRRRVDRRFSCCHGSTTRGGISRAPELAL